ncbi:hypothetical protein LZ30DRAFT_43314 [Colletotrichum cereale]|nr:hypothetical protein LZ30DRAFT_43314 [Colletotrichum cereale]
MGPWKRRLHSLLLPCVTSDISCTRTCSARLTLPWADRSTRWSCPPCFGQRRYIVAFVGGRLCQTSARSPTASPTKRGSITPPH